MSNAHLNACQHIYKLLHINHQATLACVKCDRRIRTGPRP